MNLKSILLFGGFLFTFSISASALALEPKCADQAVKDAVLKNLDNFDVSTNSCGIKALNLSRLLEAYLVCTSDETEPMEYLVVVGRETCETEYIGIASDSETPNFRSKEGLLEAVQCSVDYGDRQIMCEPVSE